MPFHSKTAIIVHQEILSKKWYSIFLAVVVNNCLFAITLLLGIWELMDRLQELFFEINLLFSKLIIFIDNEQLVNHFLLVATQII